LALPSSRSAPLRWIAEVVLGDMLGVPYVLREGSEGAITLSADGRQLRLVSQFPSLDESNWSTQMPSLPLSELRREVVPDADLEGALPILFGTSQILETPEKIQCDIDIFGALFFLLSRFEEVVLPHRDSHDRFPAVASLAWRA